MTFVDTSALLAFLDRDAQRHAEVVAAMTPVLAERSGVTHNYVLVDLVDHVSFELMRERRIDRALALDRHFR